MLLIKNGRVVDPVTNTDRKLDVLVDGAVITEVEQQIDPEACREKYGTDDICVIDAEGLVVAPGLVDTHVHFRDPGFTYKEDIITGAAAAAKGGFTSVVCMANTKPAVDNIETLEYIQKKGETTGIHVLQTASVTKELKGVELVDMEALANAGAVGFTDDGIPIMNEHVLVEAMKKAAELDLPISLHEEDPEYIQNNGVNAGKAAAFYGIGGSKRDAEITMIERDIRLALQTGATVVIQHISTKEGVELVRKGKAAGADVHAEATPHHFTLTEDAVIAKGTLAKMNPPLREEGDRQAIIEGLQDGTIDLIATDHAPHSKEEKEKPITEAPSGIIGLETALSLGIRELVQKGRLTYPQLIQRMSTAPCALYGLQGGTLEEGKTADLVIFDPEETWRVQEFASKSANSPFIGEELPGVVHATICGGQMVYRK